MSRMVRARPRFAYAPIEPRGVFTVKASPPFSADTAQAIPTLDNRAGPFLLDELKRAQVIAPRAWENLPQAAQAKLAGTVDRHALIQRLLEQRLLTDYQAARIRAGCIGELILGNYRILEFLGSGSMGKVFKAEHVRLRRPVAIKIVTLRGPESEHALERFFTEMQITAQLQHPNIAGAIDAGEITCGDLDAGEQHYLVMEFVPGHDLEALVKKSGPLEPALACDFIFQTAGALEEASRFGLVHRDIKPANIRVTPEGRVKLLDFGIAKDAHRRMTAPGIVLGSLAFLAPEQAQDASTVDIRADIYALGGTLYWCLTGRYPFEMTTNLLADLARRVSERPQPVRSLRPDLPAALEALVAKMMAPRPQDRYPDPAHVMKALVPFLNPSHRGLGGPVIGSFLENSVAALEAGDVKGAKKYRILVVDDEPQNRALFRLMLAAPDSVLYEACDGEQAVGLLSQTPCDLVLLDIDMPRMKGTEVVRCVREHPPCPHFKIIMVSGRVSSDEMAEMMLAGTDDFLTKPFTATQLRARVRSALRWKDAQDRSVQMQRQLLSVNHELEQNLEAKDSDLISARNGLVMALAELVAYRDQETGAHLLRMQQYCRCLAQQAARTPSFAGQIDDHFIHLVECCAPLHDIGKGAMPDHILLKAGKLTGEEFAIMQTHTTIGAELLQKVSKQQGFARPFLQMAIDITRHHHERYNGQGYPDRLTGEDIPLAARIVAIGDVYDALRSRRVYKPALPPDQVVRIMTRESPGHFDPALLQVFAECSDEFERIFRLAVD